MDIMVVFAKAKEGKRAELAKWYDEQHIPDLLAVPGFVSAERRELMPMKQPAGSPQWDFMLVYGIEGNALQVLQNMNGMMGTERMPTSEALDSMSTLAALGLQPSE